MINREVCYRCGKRRLKEEVEELKPKCENERRNIFLGYEEMDKGNQTKGSQANVLWDAWHGLLKLDEVETLLDDYDDNFERSWNNGVVYCPYWHSQCKRRQMPITNKCPTNCPYATEQSVSVGV